MPKIVNKDEKKQEIAFAALEVFMEKGFENSRIIDIAKGASISKGLVYQYFDSKDQVILYVMDLLWLETEEKIRNLDEKLLDEKDLLKASIDEICNFFDNDLISLRKMSIIFTELFSLLLKGKIPELETVFDRIIDSMKGMIVNILERGIKAGIFREDIDPSDEAMLLVASLDGVGMHHALKPERIDLRRSIDRYLEMFFNNIATRNGGEVND